MTDPVEPDHEEDAAPSRKGPLIALVVIVVLVGAGILLSNVLRGVGSIQDCVMAGRRNCAPIHTGG